MNGYCIWFIHFISYTRTHFLFFSCCQLPSSFQLLPAALSGVARREHSRLCMKTSTWWLYSSPQDTAQIFAFKYRPASQTFLRWNHRGGDSLQHLTTFRDERKSPPCLVTTCSGPGRMTLLKSIWIQLWWSWADGLHISKHIRMMLYVILFFAGYSVSNFGAGKQSKGSTVFLTYINLGK